MCCALYVRQGTEYLIVCCLDSMQRVSALLQLMNEIESHLEVVGVTAIEDKLQDEVPESIATLIEAGIKVWMITGDKQETAINIAISCRLFQGQDNLLICNSDSRRAATARLQEVRPFHISTSLILELASVGIVFSTPSPIAMCACALAMTNMRLIQTAWLWKQMHICALVVLKTHHASIAPCILITPYMVLALA